MKNSVIDFMFSMDSDIHGLIKKSKEYKALSAENLKIYQKLQAALKGEQLELFSKFADNSMDCEAELNEIYFKQGLKSGVRLAVECLTD